MNSPSRKPIGRWIALVLAVVAIAGGAWWAWSGPLGEPLDRARASYDRHDWAAALASANEATTRTPNDPDALRLQARALARLEQDDKAQAIYRQLGAHALRAEDLTLLGLGLIRQKNPVLGWPAIEAALLADPKQDEAARALERLKADRDQTPDAAEVAERFNVIGGAEARAELILGLLGDRPLDAARIADPILRSFRAIRMPFGSTPPPALLSKLLARMLLSMARPNEARDRLNAVLAEGPDAEASWLLSRALLQAGDAKGAAASLADARAYHGEGTITFEPAAYTGAASCGECHPVIHHGQQNSRHSRTYPTLAEVATMPLPEKPVPDPADAGVTHTIRREGDAIEAEVHQGNQSLKALVDYAFGSGHRGLTLVGHDETGQLRELRMSYYGKEIGWDRTTGHATHPSSLGTFLGRPLDAEGLHHCLDCHTTEVRAARDHTGPASSDRGIGCERCHGPAGNHIKAVESTYPEMAIALPKHATALEITNLCGQCHRPRGGAIQLDRRSAARFQAAVFSQSRCYDPGSRTFTCVTCHNPHQDARKDRAFYESKCLACHSSEEPSPSESLAKRLPSCPVNPSKGCIECHMPLVKEAMAHSSFINHSIRVYRDGDDGIRSAGD